MDWWLITLLVLAVVISLILWVPILIGTVYRSTTKTAPPARMDGKTVIVTGASGGIGKWSAMDLAERGARVIMACRNINKAQPIADDIISKTGNQNVVVKKLDLSEFESVRKFAAEINEEEPHLHVLLNNAGISLDGEKKVSKDGLEMIMATNHYGPFLLTVLLIGKLKSSAPSRVVTVSSSAHEMNFLEIDDLNYEKRNFGPFNSYGQSKLCNILFAKELSRKLEGTGVDSYSLHPGAVATELLDDLDTAIGKFFKASFKAIARTEKQGAQTSVYLCSSDKINGKPGDYFVNCKVQRVKKKAADMHLSKKLWEVSARDVKLTEAEAAILG